MASRNPFKDIEEMFERMSEQFEGLDERAERRLGGAAGFAVDIEDRDDEFVVTADLPGYDEEDISIELSGETLHVSAEEAEEVEVEGEYIQRERRQRAVSRSLRLPEPVDEEGASAAYDDGVLTVTLPKAEPEEDSESIPIS